MGVFQVFYVVQMVLNRAKRLILIRVAILILPEFLMLESRFFHSFTVEAKKEILKTSCFMLNWDIISVFLRHVLLIAWWINFRGGSRTAATSKMELFVIIVNGWKPLTIITKSSILDVAAVLDQPTTTWSLVFNEFKKMTEFSILSPILTRFKS